MSREESSPLSEDYQPEMDDPDTDNDDNNIFDQLGEDESGTTIFETRKSLKTTYTPNTEDILHRDDRRKQIARILKPIISPDDEMVTDLLMLEGTNGTGKTLISESVTTDLKRAASRGKTDLRVYTTDCSNLTTQYKVAIRTTNNILLDRGEQTIAESGFDEPTTIRKLFEQINELPSNEVVLVFDDITRVEHINDILYQVTRSEQAGTILDGSTNVTIICTANDLKFYSKLRQDVASSLVAKSIEFPPYDAQELRDILQARSEEAFVPGGITQAEIALTASLAAKKNGDARYGLQILLKAGEIGENRGLERVTEDLVWEAKRSHEKSHIRGIISEYKERTQLVLASIAIHALRRNEWPTGAEVYRTHATWTEEFAFSPYTDDMVYKRLDLFEDKELIYRDTSQEGNSKKCVLLYPPERILEGCSESIKGSIIDGEKSRLEEKDLEETTRPSDIDDLSL